MDQGDLRTRPPEPVPIGLHDLEPWWGTAEATVPGHLRWMVTYVGGPEGYINRNRETGVTSDRLVVGMMRLFGGNRQSGLHIHGVTEIYVIVKGEVESIEPGGIRHRAGPMDCLYIPPGAPHAVRAIGNADVDFVWLHDKLEKPGSARYFDDADLGNDEFPRVSLVSWRDLEHQSLSPDSREGGHLRSNVMWVGGGEGLIHLNREAGVVSTRVGVGATVLTRNNSQPSRPRPVGEIYVVAKGEAKVVGRPEIPTLRRLDALALPPGTDNGVRAVGDEDLELIWIHDELLDSGQALVN